MSELLCFGCTHSLQITTSAKEKEKSWNALNSSPGVKVEKSPTLGSSESMKYQSEGDNQSPIFFSCQCCQHTFCPRCCLAHLQSSQTRPRSSSEENQKTEENPDQIFYSRISANIRVICQECEEKQSAKYCQNCQQYLCDKCSFKIHNKGKRAKHQLDSNIERSLFVKQIAVMGSGIGNYLKNCGDEGKVQQIFQKILKNHQITPKNTVFWLDDNSMKEMQGFSKEKWSFGSYDGQSIKYEDITSLPSKYPFLSICKCFVFKQESSFHKTIQEEYSKCKNKRIFVEICEQWKKMQVQRKHERVLSQKLSLKHNKNISNFSNVSAISKVEHQSVLSNEQSDLFDSSLNITLNQNSSILMMGTYSDRDKDEEKRVDIKEVERGQNIVQMGHHRIYSIREENSHNSGNNLSTSTDHSVKKRNKKWPIPYFQPFIIRQRGPKQKAEIYLRELAEKGILMIRRQKAEQYLMDPDISRTFVRNIGEKEIQYVAYTLLFLSVECLTWVIQSIKEDKMTPNEKLIQSRLKESFDLKVNIKLWESIIRYLQSAQYDQDYFDNTQVRYVPKISVVKYGDEYLLQFEERKWAYEDQQLLDEQEQEWKQFKKLISDYFNEHNQITGGRYGCVQYVKLNGPKPLRKSSLGKLSLYVQEAINKGIIRYNKTLLVSNSQHNNSFSSQVGFSDEKTKWALMQKQLKIMAIQMALIDMFLQVVPGAHISLAQIPLNLKKTIIFDYTLVELGFPKLKNILNTLADKLLLESTKTHITYELTTNGSEAIDKMRKQVYELNQKFNSFILENISVIVLHYHTLALEDLYQQLTIRIGFPFQYKLFRFPDFYSFVLYYCALFATVQYVGPVRVVYSKYPQPQYQVFQHHQTHRTTHSQEQFPSRNQELNRSQEVSKTALKKPGQVSIKQGKNEIKSQGLSLNTEPDQMSSAIATPKFNNGSFLGRGRMDSWSQILEEVNGKEEKEEQGVDENHSREIEHIINIIDDGEVSATRPKTVIVNEGTEQQQFYLLPKLDPSSDEVESLRGEGGNWIEQDEPTKGKTQHTRFKSTNEPPVKHSRQYSTANSRK